MNKWFNKIVSLTLLFVMANSMNAQKGNTNTNKFKQLKEEMATPNVYRNAAGAPGHEYYQQKADYVINVTLDDEKQIIRGEETITYTNNSPDALEYLWLQLDQNMRSKDSDTWKIRTSDMEDKVSFRDYRYFHMDFDGGFKIEYVRDGSNKDLTTAVNKTMMRVNLPNKLAPKSSFTIKIKYWYNINDRMKMGGRSGYEYFEEDENYLYTIAQFFPRMAVYNDVEGWQNKQFLGRGEFTLPFGDYKVNITVPSDHVVSATGELQNSSSVLTSSQQNRLKKAKSEYVEPVMIITPEEALKNESSREKGTKTWSFRAQNVRDFAFASSRKFIWDAMAVKVGNKNVMAMSFYPKEGNPLWEQYSTKVVAHTIKIYSKYTIDYPYPVAQSIHTHRIGMEYPMICFNGGRPEKDGTYSERTKYGMISVIIHEVGHNFFPMIINSDERQWTWMDEGLNTFVQYLTEEEWQPDYPSRRGPAYKIVDYMKGDKSKISPIMTNSESIYQFGNNAYGKPATALNILRETVMGRELFDYSFKTYCERWAFKHPTPADFFRTMEDASSVDLDWFWRGWFYTNDHVDQSLAEVKWYQIDNGNPDEKKRFAEEQQKNAPEFIGDTRNKSLETYQDRDAKLKDFYTEYNELDVDKLDKEQYEKYLASLNEEEKQWVNRKLQYYELTIESPGGLVMPVILEFTLEDGSKEVRRIPAEIWKKNHEQVKKVFYFEKEVMNISLDPYLEIADVDRNNNNWPKRVEPTRFELYKSNRKSRENPMQRSKKLEGSTGGQQLQNEQ